MKLTNLFLGSVTAAGLMTAGGYAADLGVMSSLNMCDQLGLAGLSISSDTDCLRVTGEVSYNFGYGIWEQGSSGGIRPGVDVPAGSVHWGYNHWDSSVPSILQSEVKAKLNFEASADSTLGPAKAIIKLVSDNIGNDDGAVEVDEAYVSIGEGTIIMAGHKGSVFNNGDDEPLNWLGLFNSEAVNSGVTAEGLTGTSNAVQFSTEIGTGVIASVGLENLEANGTAVGVLAYRNDTLSAHVSIAADDVLQGGVGDWEIHGGVAATIDQIKLVAAFATDDEANWNVLGSAEATLDMFTIAGSVEAQADDYKGAGASVTASVAEGVKLNVGGRWADFYNHASYEVAVGAEARVAEDLTVSGAVGYVSGSAGDGLDAFNYGWAKVAWAPGGGFTASVKGTATYSDDWEEAYGNGYKMETEFKKSFE